MEEQTHQADVRDLARFGYQQELRRVLGVYSSFAVAFSYIDDGTQEIGTGLPGIVSLIAAETLGVDIGSVEVCHGDTHLPETSGTFGSSATMAVGSAVAAAAGELRAKLDVGADATREQVEGLARAQIAEWLQGKEPKKIVYVEKKLMNFVV